MLDGKIILVDDNESVVKTLKIDSGTRVQDASRSVRTDTFGRLCCVRAMSILSCWI